MKQIYKYPVWIKDVQTVEMPYGSRIIKAGEQHGRLFIWAIVVTDKDCVQQQLKICIFGTGQDLPYNIYDYHYIDTVICSDGLVWHIFELV